MPKAVWNDVVLADSDETVIVEGNHYFPPDSVNMEYFTPTEHHTLCPWKGIADYYTVSVNGDTRENGAWSYKSPKEAAQNIKDYIAFYAFVQILE